MPPVSFSKFVGRLHELGSLQAGLDDALQGRGRLFVISGEAGIGKTRLADELDRYARARGAKVLRGVCYEHEGAPAFWPWSQVAAALANGHERTAGNAQLALSRLAPEVEDAPAAQPELARFRLFDGVTAHLRRAAARQPLVLVLDDLHWADKPSLLLLEFVAREMESQPILLLACYREFEAPLGHPLTQTLGYLLRLPITERLELRGLSPPEVLELLHEAAGEADEAAASRIHADTNGNPLFIGEIVRLFAGSGHISPAAGYALPRGIGDIISRRLQGLSVESRRMLEVASVLGREFSLTLLSDVAGRAPGDLAPLLGEAEDSHVLEGGERLGSYMFVHALVQQSLQNSLTATRRLQLHHQVAGVLERLHQQGARVPMAQLAYHAERAAPLGEPLKASDYAYKAGEEALRALAFEQAAEYFDQALQMLRAMAMPEPQRELDALLALGDAQSRAGDRPAAKGTFLEAASLARAAGSAEHLGRATLGYGGVWVTAGSVDHVLVELIDESLSGIEASGSLTARLQARLAQELYYTASEEHLGDLTAQAVASARASGDSRALAAALGSRHQALRRPDDLDERLQVADEVIRLAMLASDDELALQGHHWKLVDLIERASVGGVQAEQAACHRLAAKLRQPYHQWWTMVPAATMAMLRGDFKDGEQLARSALAAGQQAQEPAADPFFEAQLFVLRLEGLLPPDTDTLRLLADRFPSIPVWRAALAWLQLETGSVEAARADFLRLFEGQQPNLPRDGNETIGLACLAAACLGLGDRERAASLYGALLPYAARNVHTSRLSACLGPAALYLGELAHLLGRPAQARSHFEMATAICERMGFAPWLARTKIAYARLVQPSDEGHAAMLTGQARALASDYGMTRLLERIDGAGAAGAVRPGRLTAREEEILRLLAEGLTSQEISRQLVLSIHTVNRHAANIYAKIGARGRADAVAFAFRHGIAGPG